MKTTGEKINSTLRSKLAGKTLVGFRTETWGDTTTATPPMIKVAAKVGEKGRPIRG